MEKEATFYSGRLFLEKRKQDGSNVDDICFTLSLPDVLINEKRTGKKKEYKRKFVRHIFAIFKYVICETSDHHIIKKK